jgi:hypothetical protein
METLFWILGLFVVLPIFAALFIHRGLHDVDEEYPWWDNEDYGDKS